MITQPRKRETITQPELAQVHHHHPHRIRTDHLDDEQQRIYNALQQGAKVAPGELGARIETREFRPRIRWRDEVKKLKGPQYVTKLEDETRRKGVKEIEYLVFE